jgi:flagellar biogenesis protein FliO
LPVLVVFLKKAPFHKPIFVLSLLLVLFLAAIIASPASPAKEATRNPEDLKAGPLPSPAASAGEAVEMTPAPAKVPATAPATSPGPSPSASPEAQVTPSPLPPGETAPAGWGGVKEEDESWKPDPKRGIPRFNLGLTLLSLLIVSLLAYWGVKVYFTYVGGDNKGGLSGRKLMRVRERQVIGPNKQICLVELPGKTVLLGITENEMTVLTELDADKIAALEQDAPAASDAGPSPSSYLMDVIMRRWPQGGK